VQVDAVGSDLVRAAVELHSAAFWLDLCSTSIGSLRVGVP
jgi:hypothetical protein